MDDRSEDVRRKDAKHGIVTPSPVGVVVTVPLGAQANSVSFGLTFDDIRRIEAALNTAVTENRPVVFMIEGEC